MHRLRRLCIALALLASLGAPAFADHARHRDRSDRGSAERRHPRPGTGHGDRYREHRQYRPHRSYGYGHRYRNYGYRGYYRPLCRYQTGYWEYDRYGEYFVPTGSYVAPCR